MSRDNFIKAPELRQGYVFKTPQGTFIVVDVHYDNDLKIYEYLVHKIDPDSVAVISKQQIQDAFNNDKINF